MEKAECIAFVCPKCGNVFRKKWTLKCPKCKEKIATKSITAIYAKCGGCFAPVELVRNGKGFFGICNDCGETNCRDLQAALGGNVGIWIKKFFLFRRK
jgi:DNA-directed RNA polymerase subunit RPC12/RpoP